jgi:pimeloyl-ACP methyl ester carboxylesterase
LTAIVTKTWPGPPPAILLVHATGFCKEVWSPVVDELRSQGVDREVVALDQRGHGDSPAISGDADWWDLGRDALDVALGLGTDPIGVGHSSGGAALLMAELLEPGTFRALVLVEPIVFPPSHEPIDDSPMSEAALRRKRVFASRQDALSNFRGRGPFARWDDRVLEAYVDGCMDDADGELRLKCLPEVEAAFYRAGTAHGAWDRMGEVAVDSIIVAGDDSLTHPADFAASQAARFPNAVVEMVPNATHFVPMEQPRRVAAIIADCVEQERR